MPTRKTKIVSEGAGVMNPLDMDAWARRRVSGPGFRAFLAIADEWKLSEEERLRILGRPARSTYHLWASKVRSDTDLTLSLDVLTRISAVLGIYKGLKIIFARNAEAVEWLHNGNTTLLFGGQSPFDLIASGSQDHLMLVRRHLDAWRGGLFAAPDGEIDSAASVITDQDILYV